MTFGPSWEDQSLASPPIKQQLQRRQKQAGRVRIPAVDESMRTLFTTLPLRSYSTFLGKGLSWGLIPLQGHCCTRLWAKLPAHGLFLLSITVGHCVLGGWLPRLLLPQPGNYMASSAEPPKAEQSEWEAPLPRDIMWATRPHTVL